MNSETSIKKTTAEDVTNPEDIKSRGKSRSGRSLLFWLCAVVAAVFFSVNRGSIKFGAWVLFCTIFCMACDFFKPRIFYRSDKGIILALFLLCGGISVFLLFSFANVGDVDFACYTNVMWNTLHGKFLYQSFLQQNLLAVHLMPAALVFVPFYALLGNYGLVIAQTLAWAGGLWLLLLNEKSGQGAPRLLVIGVAALPPVIAPLFYGFHPDVLFFPVSAWAILAFKKKSLLQFCLAVMLLPLIKEVFILASLYFAFLAFWEKRSLYWSVPPALISLTFVLMFWFVLSPALRTGSSHVFISMLPASLGGIIGQLFSHSGLFYLFSSVLIVLPILLSHSVKLALFPLPFFLFYTVLPDQSFHDHWRHYAFAGTWVALFSLSFCSSETLRRIAAPVFLISLCFCYSWIPLLSAPHASAQKRSAITYAIALVSSDKKLVAHGPFMAPAAERHFIMNWIYANNTWHDYDYFLYDCSFRPTWWSGRDSMDLHLRHLLESPDWKPVFHQESIYLFKKTL
jgi:hypothetical protein